MEKGAMFLLCSREKWKLQWWHFCHINHKGRSEPVLRDSRGQGRPQPSLLRSSHLPSCFPGTDTYQEKCRPQRPHLIGRWPPHHVSAPHGVGQVCGHWGHGRGLCHSQDDQVLTENTKTFKSVEKHRISNPDFNSLTSYKKVKYI